MISRALVGIDIRNNREGTTVALHRAGSKLSMLLAHSEIRALKLSLYAVLLTQVRIE